MFETFGVFWTSPESGATVVQMVVTNWLRRSLLRVNGHPIPPLASCNQLWGLLLENPYLTCWVLRPSRFQKNNLYQGRCSDPVTDLLRPSNGSCSKQKTYLPKHLTFKTGCLAISSAMWCKFGDVSSNFVPKRTFVAPRVDFQPTNE